MSENIQHIAGSVLFVDDEQNVLEGLKRVLRLERQNYTSIFASSGQEALELLQDRHFDVVVTDTRMPEMNGLQLLSEVKKRYPAVIRIILSGDADLDTRMKSINISHQFLPKPCDAATLKSTIYRTCQLSRLLNSDSIKRVLTQIDTLPSLPSIYMEIIQELQSPDASMKKIGEIITRDVAMSSKILRLVNSAYFCLPRHISSPEHAAVILGMDTIRSLVLATKIFNKFESSNISDDFFRPLWEHNFNTGKIAKSIARKETQDQKVIDHAFMAGLLHDSGKLILAYGFTNQYADIIDESLTSGESLWEVEKNFFGITHAEAGAYLMGLWGLPFPVIEAIAYHHSPGLNIESGFSPLTAVHIANILEHERFDPEKKGPPQGLNDDYLAGLEFNKNRHYWTEIRQNISNGVY